MPVPPFWHRTVELEYLVFLTELWHKKPKQPTEHWHSPKLEVSHGQFSPTRFLPVVSLTYDQYHWSFPSTRQIPWHFLVFQKRGDPELTTENNDDWLTDDAKLPLMCGSRSATRRAQGIHRSALHTASISSSLVSGVRRWTKLTHVGRGYYWDGWLSSGGNTILVCNKPTRSTQPCIPPGELNRVPASAGVRAGMSPLPGGR